MSEVDKLVNSMDEELNSPNEYSLSTNPDSNPSYILINPDRTLSVPENLRKIGIQHDHNVESLVFKCPRYNDGIDLSTMSNIAINWTNSKGTSGKADCHSITHDDNYLTFIWTVAQDVTFERGMLTILVCMIKQSEVEVKGEMTIIDDLHWNSEMNKELYVGDGLFVSGDEVVNKHDPELVSLLLSKMSATEKTVNSYRIDSEEIPDGSGYTITMTDGLGTETVDVLHGHAADKGATFTPSVTEDGVLSWTNDQGLPNPDPIVIKGAKGDRGETVYVPSVSENGILSWTNDGGLENPTPVNIKGQKGDRGYTGAQGPVGKTGMPGPMGTVYQEITLTDNNADVDPYQKYRIYIDMKRKSFIDSAIDLFGEDDSSWYISHAVTIDGDIYYIEQTTDNTAWPKLMKYSMSTHERIHLRDFPKYAFDPIGSNMYLDPIDNETLSMHRYAKTEDYGKSCEWKYKDRVFLWSTSRASEYYAGTIHTEGVTTHAIATAGYVMIPGEESYSGYYRFGGYSDFESCFVPRIYKLSWQGSTTSYHIWDEVKIDYWTPVEIVEDSYISTTAVVDNKAYLFSPRTGKVTIFNFETQDLEQVLDTNIRDLANITFDEETKLSNISSTFAIGDKIYLLVAGLLGSSKCIVFDTKTNACSVVSEKYFNGKVPTGDLTHISDGNSVSVTPTGFLPTIYLNNKPYIINHYKNPVFFEDPGDMKDEYLYLTSPEFGSEKIYPISQDLYDKKRGYFEFEIHKMSLNDIGTSLEINHTYNDKNRIDSFIPPWVDNDVTKDISLIKLHVENASKVLVYNDNIEHSNITDVVEELRDGIRRELHGELSYDVSKQVAAANKVTRNEIKALFSGLQQKNVFAVAEGVENTSHVRQTADGDVNGITVVDNSYTDVTRIQGDTVRCENLINIPNQVLDEKGETWVERLVDINGTFTISFDANIKEHASTLIALKINGNSEYVKAVSPSEKTQHITQTFTGHLTRIVVVNYGFATGTATNFMLNYGDTALPYQPYFTGLKNAEISGIKSTGRNLLNSFATPSWNDATMSSAGSLQVISEGTLEGNSSYATGGGNGISIGYLPAGTTITISAILSANESLINASSFGAFLLSRKIEGKADSIYSHGFSINGDKKEVVGIITADVSAEYYFRPAYLAPFNKDYRFTLENVMINIGDIVLPYEPYIESVMTLPETELGEWDTIHPQTGALTKATGRKVYSGSDIIDNQTQKYEKVWFYYVNKPSTATCYVTEDKYYRNGNIFIPSKYILTDAYTDTSEAMIGKIVGLRKYIQIGIGFPPNTTLEEAQAAIDGLEIAYEIKTPNIEYHNMSMSKNYIVWDKGQEIVNDENATFGTKPRITNDYMILGGAE